MYTKGNKNTYSNAIVSSSVSAPEYVYRNLLFANKQQYAITSNVKKIGL